MFEGSKGIFATFLLPVRHITTLRFKGQNIQYNYLQFLSNVVIEATLNVHQGLVIPFGVNIP